MKLGGKVVVVVEFEKGKGVYVIYKDFGFIFEELEVVKVVGSLIKVVGVKELFMDEFWVLNVEVIVLCVLENVIINYEVELIKVGIVCEGVNGLIILEVDEVFYKKGIVVIFDVLINVGGVIVFYFEWV